METLDHTTRLFFSLSPSSTAKLEKNADGTATLRGLEVFKAGTFRDSVGELGTWSPDHLRMLVDNYNLLASKGIFPSPPMRKGHTRSMDSVVGYVRGLSTDGSKLRADVALTEPDAVGKYERGTFRGRSAEIGAYQANDESVYWPVMKGVAFVDMPAVEGLYEQQKQLEAAFVIFDEPKENSVDEKEWVAAATYAQFEVDSRHAQALVDWERAATYAQALTDLNAVPASFAAPTTGTLTFSLNGQPSTDIQRVQAHIATLEQFHAETRNAGRTSFVEGLATAKKITAPQVKGLSDFALSLNDEQYTAFRASYENAPVIPLFGQYASGTTNEGGEGADEAATQQKNDLEVVSMHRKGHVMSEDQIKQTPSFQRLVAAGVAV